MTKIEQAKDKLFKAIGYFDCFHWDSMHSPEKDLKFHKGDNEAYYRESKGLKEFSLEYLLSENYEMPETADGWFESDYDRGQVLFTADIAIFHKDYVKYIVEIVDEFYIDREKLGLIDDFFNGIDYYQIKADDIINCKNLREVDFFIFQQLGSLDEMIRVVTRSSCQ
jgi:hypothetical protein